MFITKLETALGNEARFAAVIAEMKSAKLDAKTLKAICKGFAKTRSTSKADAFAKIEARQENIIGGRLRLEATGNRTAA
jgi:hypothetical protein